MDKITIIPGSVRGYGDVVSPKTIEDFEVFDSELSFEDGLYTLVYDASGVSVGLSVSSSTISVGGSVVLTAEVLSAGEPAVGETVSFYDGSTLLGTDETDSDGIATYTASSLGVGSHSLTAEALDKSSSAVTVTVNKLTSTITISVPSTGTVGTSYTVSGTLVPTSGSVKLYENGSLKDTLTVSSGSFSKAITQSNEGTYSYYAVFEGSSTYSSVTSSTGSIVVSDVPPVPVVTSVSLTGDKSILSYADSESATLSATVLDQSSQPMSGVTVEFFNGSTSMGTADTNSSGIATKTYASTGAGDLSFTASVGTISSETYSIEDCILYDSLTSASGKWTIPSGVTSEYSSDGWKISANAYKQIKLTDKLTSACSVEFTISDYYASNLGQYPPVIIYQYTNGETTPNQLLLMLWNATSFDALGTRINHALIKGGVYKIEYDSTMKLYENDTLLASASNDVGLPTRFEYHIGTNGRYAIYKDLKVKPL